MDCSPPGSSVHGILQARILEWVAMPSSRGSSRPRDRTQVSRLLHWQAGSLPLAPPGEPYTSKGFPGGKVLKNPPASAGDAGDLGLIPESGKIPWRRAWQPTPVFLPGESHGHRSLAGYSPWGPKESDMTECLTHTHTHTHTHMHTHAHVYTHTHVGWHPRPINSEPLALRWVTVRFHQG